MNLLTNVTVDLLGFFIGVFSEALLPFGQWEDSTFAHTIPIIFQDLDCVICLTALLTYFYIGSAARLRRCLASILKSNGYTLTAALLD